MLKAAAPSRQAEEALAKRLSAKALEVDCWEAADGIPPPAQALLDNARFEELRGLEILLGIPGKRTRPYGLSGVVYTGSEERAERVGRAVRRGSVLLRALQDLLAGVRLDQVGVVGSDVGLDLLDQFVLGLGFDGCAAWAVDPHEYPPLVVGDASL